MLKYIIKRILLLVLVVAGVMVFVFIVSRATGDPVAARLGESFTQEQYDLLYQEMGLDKPYVVQFLNYVWDVLHGDLGKSYTNNASVYSEVMSRFPFSLRIAVFTLLWSIPLGVLFGIISAVKQYSPLDYTVTTFSMICSSLPAFWVALMLMLIFSLYLKLLPATGLSTWRGYILPCVASGMVPMAHMARLARTTMLEVIRQDYIRTARSKGLAEHIVILKHAVRNAAIPLVTQIGSSFATIVGSAAVVESIYQIPGVGNFIALSISNRDYPSVQGAVLLFSIFVCLMNLIIDLLYAVIDPRIKAKYSNTVGILAMIKMRKLSKEAGDDENG